MQYRDKSGDHERRAREAQQLLDLCEQAGARLIINDDLALALRVEAHGVHLGQGDGDPAEARRLLGPTAILGVTCHDSLPLARQAVVNGASYVAFGRFFPSRTKPEASPAPLSLLREARAALPNTPLVAIGGITLDNAHTLIAAGADTLAVSHSLFGADAIEARARTFTTLFNQHSST